MSDRPQYGKQLLDEWGGLNAARELERRRSKRVIAFAGRNGSGKETAAARVAATYGARHHTYSDVLAETFRLWGVDPSSRPQQQALSTFMCGLLGQDAVAKVIDRKCAEAKTRVVVIDGVRRLVDIENLRRDWGDRFILIWIEVDRDIRYARLKARKEKQGEAMMPWEEFLQQEVAETELQLDQVRAACHRQFDNNGPRESLFRQIDTFLYETEEPVAFG